MTHQPNNDKAMACARFFHDTYERLAPSFGYETRHDTKTFDPESKNGRLMVAVCGEFIRTHFPQPSREVLERVKEALEIGHNCMTVHGSYDRRVDAALTELRGLLDGAQKEGLSDGRKIVGTGFYRDAKPGTFGPSEWLDLFMACQDGCATCMRVMEFIDRETVPIGCIEKVRGEMLDVCHEIERLPASARQTDLSMKASAVVQELQRLAAPTPQEGPSDGEMLDWLEKNGEQVFQSLTANGWFYFDPIEQRKKRKDDLRSAIRAAMSASHQKGEGKHADMHGCGHCLPDFSCHFSRPKSLRGPCERAPHPADGKQGGEGR